jgi:hypothetical protein
LPQVLKQRAQGWPIIPIHAVIQAPELKERNGRFFVQCTHIEALLVHPAAQRRYESHPVFEAALGISLFGEPFCKSIDVSAQGAEVQSLQGYPERKKLIRHVLLLSAYFFLSFPASRNLRDGGALAEAEPILSVYARAQVSLFSEYLFIAGS